MHLLKKHNTKIPSIRVLYIVLCLLTAGQMVHAQTEVSGKIMNESGDLLVGVNILVKGTNVGTITELDGSYALEVENENAVLVISYIGYITQEVSISGRSVVDVNLSIDAAQLEEVVIIGYGKQRKQDITGSIAVVDVDAMEASAFTSVTDRLQGRAAGVQVINNGQPGSIGTIRIRGAGFTGGNNDPLFVIDGVLTEDSRNLNPNDIESIQVLKDASSSAIYGSRAANGVVVITTKKGKQAKPRITFSAMAGIQQIPDKVDVMNAAQWSRITNAAYDVDGRNRLNDADDLSHGYDTDWQDEVYQDGLIQDLNASIAVGDENRNVYFSLGNTYQEGTVKGPIFNRFTARINSEFEVLPGLRVGENITFGRSETSGLDAEEVIFNAIDGLPIIPVYNPYELSGYGIGDFADAFSFTPNAVGHRDLFKSKGEEMQVLGNVFARYEIIQGLEYQFNFGFNFTSNFTKNWQKQGIITMTSPHMSGTSEHRSDLSDLFFEHRLTYNRTINKHSFSFMSSYIEQERTSTFNSIGIIGGFDDVESYQIQLSTAAPNNVTVNGGKEVQALRSILGRVTYNYDNRYMLTINVRRDGDSRFSEENRWATFPSASIGWNLANESFFNVPSISSLKIRVGYGEVGSVSIGNYAYQSKLGSANYNIGVNATNAIGLTRAQLVDRNIKWESLQETNIGLDLELFDGKFEFIGDYYFGDLNDLLFNVSVPGTVGVTVGAEVDEEGGLSAASVITNAASSKRSGWELGLTYRKRSGDFNFSIGANAFNSYVELTRLPMGVSSFIQAEGISRLGSTYGEFFVHQYEGIYTSQAEIDAHGVTVLGAVPQVGDARYKDTNGRDADGNLTGQPDGNINADDRSIAGNSYPKVQFGLIFEASYKNFDFMAFFQGVAGRELYNGRYKEMNQNFQTNFTTDYDPYIEGTGTDPRVSIIDQEGGNFFASTRFIEDASYGRLKNLQVGYTFYTKKISSIRLYIGGQNLFTLTKFKGQDPEFESGDIFNPGVYPGSFPNIRTFNTGINVLF